MTLWTVYQIVGSPMGAVYVGLTSDPWTRWTAHKSRGPVSEWLAQHPDIDLTMVSIEEFADREDAANLERRLIKEYAPVLNATSATGGRPRIGSEAMTNRGRKPWLDEKPPISERTWYRRRREKADE